MAIAVVGTPVGGGKNNGGNVSLSITGVADGNIIYICGGHFTRAGNIGPSQTGFATTWTEVYLDTSLTNSFGVWRTTWHTGDNTAVVGQGDSDASDASAYAVIVLSGVDPTTPEDVTRTLATSSTYPPNPAAIVPASNNCMILICAGGDYDTSPGTVTNYTSVFGNGSDTNSLTAALGRRLLSGGGGSSEDPGGWNTWSGSNAWRTVTVAIRPYVPLLSSAPYHRALRIWPRWV